MMIGKDAGGNVTQLVDHDQLGARYLIGESVRWGAWIHPGWS